MTRPPLVAGRFYPSRRETLSRDLNEYCAPRTSDVRALACLVPHAGYMYSGAVAGAVYAALDLPKRFVILAPDHFGRGSAFGLHPADEWETPLGRAPVDADLAAKIRPFVEEDERGHAEHSLEVQLPFLQFLLQEFSFVPISIRAGDLASLTAFGEALAAVIAENPALIVASSDMNHYESDRITRRKDNLAIDAMLALDPARLHETLRRENISMCGYGPAIVAIAAAQRLGSREARLVHYATSGDARGADRNRVVGYAGMAFLNG